MRTPLYVLLAGLLLAGCRGTISEKPPVHVSLNMDYMERYEAQEESDFFEDRRAMRPPVPGTVARGMLREDVRYHTGREADGSYVARTPLGVTREFVLRGRERYDIYCAVCHGRVGDGLGPVMTGGYGFAPISYHNDRLREIGDGYLYEVIADGIRTMPAYAQQIPVADRWAIVTYIRALQRSQNASEGDIPADILSDLAR